MYENLNHPIIAPQTPTRLRRSGLRRRVQTIAALILREMASRYGRSPGGYIWAVLEPLGMIILLSFGFAMLLRSPSLGNNFLIFYATGYLPYNLFMKTSQVIMGALASSKALLTYPAVSWFDAISARAILHILTETLVAYLLLAGILALTENKTILDFGPILMAFTMAAVLGIGIGLVNCVIIGFFPIWQTTWNILTRPLFLASGVLWILTDLPPGVAKILFYNPLVHITGTARAGFFPMYEPQFVSYTYVMGIGMTLTALGLLLMRRYHREILSRR